MTTELTIALITAVVLILGAVVTAFLVGAAVAVLAVVAGVQIGVRARSGQQSMFDFPHLKAFLDRWVSDRSQKGKEAGEQAAKDRAAREPKPQIEA